jgi:hypothetical protein
MSPAQSMTTSAKRQTASGVDFGRLDRAFIIWSNRGTDAARQKLRCRPSRMDVKKSPTIWANSKERKMSRFPRILRFCYFAGASRFLHSAPRAVAATGCVAVVTLLLHTGALAQTDPYLDKIQKQQENYCAISGNCNEPNRSNSGGGGDSYVALALSSSTLKTGMGWAVGSRDEAEQLALEYCRGQGASDCRPVQWAKFCIAVATSDLGKGGGAGYDWDFNRVRAQAKAMALCKQFGGQNCEIQQSACSNDPPNGSQAR